MKKWTLIPAFMALVILLGGPFGLGSRCDSDPRGGLVCFCCEGLDKHCTMISCSGCGCGQGGHEVTDRWLPVMIPEPLPAAVVLPAAAGDRDTFGPPRMVYLDVPDKPPKKA